MTSTDLKTSDFDFELPHERIAQDAIEPRDHARLLRVQRDALSDHRIYDLPNLLRQGDLLILNDTRVLPARLYGMRGAMRVEILLHKRYSGAEWLAFARPGKRLRVGDRIDFAPDFAAELIAKNEHGIVHLKFNVADDAFLAALKKNGLPPLPPYIKREGLSAKVDSERYQTIYAAREGAVAAPTAGLHFTHELILALTAKGVEMANVTLHVGAGTFLPVKAEFIKDHIMHSEWGEMTAETAETINKARHEKRRVIAVGTTSLRVVESATDVDGVVRAFAQETDIFIHPGYTFRAIDALVTNFHLPQSTLFMLVSALMGRQRMRDAYAYAIKENYRFYSYGDACLLEP